MGFAFLEALKLPGTAATKVVIPVLRSQEDKPQKSSFFGWENGKGRQRAFWLRGDWVKLQVEGKQEIRVGCRDVYENEQNAAKVDSARDRILQTRCN